MKDANCFILPLGLVAAPLMLQVVEQRAYATEYLSVEQAQGIIFPTADKFKKIEITLQEQERVAIRKKSGVRPRENELKVWQALQQGKSLGYLFVDDVIGKHDYITYALGLDPSGRIQELEILSYRENIGGEVREKSWRKQFKSKGPGDDFEIETSIRNISGATLSCRHVTEGVKRLIATFEVTLLENHKQVG